MKQFYILMTALLFGCFGYGQTLSAGDLAIIGLSVDDEEALIVALVNIPAGESVFFTDDEWNGSSFNSGEGFYEWVTPAITPGTVFTIDTNGSSAGGTVTQRAGSFTLSNSGDGFFFYQTSTNTYNTGTYTVLGFAGEDAGDSGNLSGTGLTQGSNAVYFGGDNGIYTGTRVDQDKATYLSLIYDDNNWATSGTSQTFDLTNFTFGTSGPENPDTFSATTASASQIDLNYAENAAENTVVIIFNTDNNFDTPSGTPSVPGTFGDDEILFVGNGSGSYNHTGLNENTTYYYRAYSYDGSAYSVGLSAQATTDLACPSITALTIDSFTDSEATISWTPGDTETAWEIVVQESGTGIPLSNGTATTDNPYAASGLTGSTAYEVYVRADCTSSSDGYSAWVGPVTFTTLPSCPNISNLNVDSFTDNDATISWTAGDTETAWEIVVQESGTGTPLSNGTATTDNPYTASGLTGSTAYEVYVRADCTSSSDGYSAWVGPVTFTTECSVFTPDYVEDFSSIIPDCWNEADDGTVATGPTDLGSSDWEDDGFSNNGSTGAYRINLYRTGTSDWLLTPKFDLTGDPFQVDFDFGIMVWNSSTTAGTLGSDDTVQFLISTDNGITWSSLIIFDNTSVIPVTGTQIRYDLTAYSGQTVQFAFLASEGSIDDAEDNDIFIDNFVVTELIDGDTEVYEPATQVSATTVVAANTTTSATAVDSFGFIIEDQATTDNLTTNVSQMRFTPGTNNTADWTDHIQGITLVDENSNVYSPTVSISDTEIVLNFGTPIAIGNGSSLEFLLGLYLNTAAIVDGSIIQLQIEATNSGFEADGNGSHFAETFLLGTLESAEITINVVATELAFSEQPSDVIVFTAMTPSVEVTAIDSNGNTDLDFTAEIVLSPSTPDIFDASVTTAIAAEAGVATFDNLVFEIIGSLYSLTASSGSLTETTSSSFEVTELPVGPICALTLDFENSGGYDTSITEFNDNDADYFTRTNLASLGSTVDLSNVDGSFFAAQDIDALGDEIPAFLTITNINIENLTELEFSIDLAEDDDGANEDWDVGDYVHILYSIDGGSNQNLIWIENNGNTFNSAPYIDTDFDGTGNGTEITNIFTTFTQSIASSGQTMTITVEFNLDSGDEDIAIDNIKLCGIANGPTYTYNDAWSSDPNGINDPTASIIIASGDAIFSNDVTVNLVTVNPGASLTIEIGNTLTVNDNITLESTSSSYSSLILEGTIAGTVNYERFVNANVNGNDLIASPVSGQSWADFLNSDNNITSLLNDGGSIPGRRYSFGPFSKSTGAYVTWADNQGTSLEAGVGYRAATQSGTTLTFTGTIPTGQVSSTISFSGPALQDWNLIGNPYPSYIDTSAFLNFVVDAGTDPVTRNLDYLAEGSGIYGYDGDASNGWRVITLANVNDPGNALIAPGQGFLVPAADDLIGNTADILFDPSMRRAGSAGNFDDFIAGRSADNPPSFFKLSATTTTKSYETQFYFNTQSSLGLDHGYDGKILGAVPSFAVYSHLIQDNTGIAMALQSLNTSDLGPTTIIPLGVHANAGEYINFHITESNLPEGTQVFLEDTLTNSFTLLNSGDYSITTSTALNGTGRFYLRFGETALSTVETSLDHIQIYSNEKDATIVISGTLRDGTLARLYDLQGRLMSSTKLSPSTRVHTIEVKALRSGVYVVQLQNAQQSKTQKVLLR